MSEMIVSQELAYRAARKLFEFSEALAGRTLPAEARGRGLCEAVRQLQILADSLILRGQQAEAAAVRQILGISLERLRAALDEANEGQRTATGGERGAGSDKEREEP